MRRTQLITTAALVAACAVPATAAAQGHDLRSPDARDAAAAAEEQAYQDLRSPDTRDAARATLTREYLDLRSPDARDAGRTPVDVPTPVVEIREVPASGFDWGDAGIGAGFASGLLTLVAATGLLWLRRRTSNQFQTS